MLVRHLALFEASAFAAHRGRESSGIISSFSRTNEFVGIQRAAAEPVPARAVVHMGRCVYEGAEETRPQH